MRFITFDLGIARTEMNSIEQEPARNPIKQILVNQHCRHDNRRSSKSRPETAEVGANERRNDDIYLIVIGDDICRLDCRRKHPVRERSERKRAPFRLAAANPADQRMDARGKPAVIR